MRLASTFCPTLVCVHYPAWGTARNTGVICLVSSTFVAVVLAADNQLESICRGSPRCLCCWLLGRRRTMVKCAVCCIVFKIIVLMQLSRTRIGGLRALCEGAVCKTA